MSRDLGEGSSTGDRERSPFDGKAERFYMNKAYGRSLDRARARDERPGGQEGEGGLQRATIEPDSGGGHKVIVERSAMVIPGGRERQPAGRSEHSFAKPEDAVEFLRDILHGRLPLDGEAEKRSEAGGGSGNERHANGIEELLGDALSGASGRG